MYDVGITLRQPSVHINKPSICIVINYKYNQTSTMSSLYLTRFVSITVQGIWFLRWRSAIVLESLDCIYNMHQFFMKRALMEKKLLQSHMYNRNNVNDEMN